MTKHLIEELLPVPKSRNANSTRSARGNGTSATKMLTGTPLEPRRAQSRGTARAGQILRIAEKMFCERGYAATSMDDLAAEVGILKGSLYYYVDSKDDLLFRIVDGVHTVVNATFEAAAVRDDLSPLNRVVEYVHAQLLHNAANVAALTVYHRDWLHLEDARLTHVQECRREHGERFRALLEEAQAGGEIPESTDLHLAMNHTFAVAIWPYTWYQPKGRVTAAELAATGAEFVRAGLSGWTNTLPEPIRRSCP